MKRYQARERIPVPERPGGPQSRRGRARLAALALAAGLYLLRLNRAVGEDHVDYRFEAYQEDDGRIRVETQSALFEKRLTSWLSLKGEAVYDAISGATPNGVPSPAQVQEILQLPSTGPLSTKVPTIAMRDWRSAGSLEPTLSLGPHRLSPQFAYSSEHDYVSYGAGLGYALDLNQKNTTLNFGWSHDWDTIILAESPGFRDARRKNTDNFLVGINQLLSPKTVLTVNFTFRNAEGYLDDPYRKVMFDDYAALFGDPTVVGPFPERRPGHREGYIGYASLTQYVTPLHGSVEGAYRFYHDSYGIDAHTLELGWHQKVGRAVQVSPLFRYYEQSAATFYATHFAGEPSDPPFPTPIPAYFSADYRLSRMETFTYGLSLTAKVTDWFSLDLAYKRYEMFGLDHATSPSMYPKANIFTMGARIWF